MPTPSLRFGDHVLVPFTRSLETAGQPVPLGARAFDVLVALVERRERVVTKAELLDAVWPDTVVEENNLQVQISTLRKVLGAGAIATIPGRGYRFVVPVEVVDGTSAVPTAPAARAAHDLIGREADLRDLVAALTGTHRVVTVVGPGGVGKTVLARALVATALPAGRETAWIALADVTDGAQVAATLAAGLGVAPGGADPVAAIARAIAQREVTVLLDNAEHLVAEVASLVAALVDATPGLRFLVTSQVPLGLRDEALHRLEPLACPPDPGHAAAEGFGATALGYAAVALFAARAAASDRRFDLTDANAPAIAEICRRLDGMPLAIELAAARARELGVSVLRDSLAQRFRMLTSKARDVSARHRSLRATLEWSHGLLDDGERALFRQLGVFANGFTLPLALAVAGSGEGDWETTDRLAALAERSFVAVDHGDPPRYVLPQTMRAYALEELAAAGEEQAVRARHAHALHAFYARTRRQMLGDAEQAAARQELDNVRDAFFWAREHEPALAADLATLAARFTVWDARRRETLGWLASCEAIMTDAMPARIRADWWLEFARYRLFNRHPQASDAARHALALYRELEDDHDIVQALAALVRGLPKHTSETQPALAEIDALLARHPEWPARTRHVIAGTHAHALTTADELDVAEAMRYRLEEAAFAAAMGNPRARNAAETNVIALLRAQERHAEVRERAQALLARLRGTNETGNLVYACMHLLDALLATGRLDEARTCAIETWEACRTMNLPLATDPTALLVALEGRVRTAARLLAFAHATYARLNFTKADVTEAYLAKVAQVVRKSLDDAEIAGLTAEGSAWTDEEAHRAAFGTGDG